MELGMHQTRDGTDVLLCVATGSRKAAVHCGAGVHPHADDASWQSVIRDAALSGAENRLRVERMRYDEAAASYNAAAGSAWTGLWARSFGVPAHVSLSDEVDW